MRVPIVGVEAVWYGDVQKVLQLPGCHPSEVTDAQVDCYLREVQDRI
jgi:hypothetical protein